MTGVVDLIAGHAEPTVGVSGSPGLTGPLRESNAIVASSITIGEAKNWDRSSQVLPIAMTW